MMASLHSAGRLVHWTDTLTSSSSSISISMSSSSSVFGRFDADCPSPSSSMTRLLLIPPAFSRSSCSYSPCAFEIVIRAASIALASFDFDGSSLASVAFDGFFAYAMC